MRTRDLRRWSANPTRLAKRLVAGGVLFPLAHGLYAAPRRSRFGNVPPDDGAVMRAFLDGAPFVFSGPRQWNALGLGATALFAAVLVYNTKRSGAFVLGGRHFLLRRVAFPRRPSPEWFVVDLFEHADQAGVARSDLVAALGKAVGRARFDRLRLRDLAQRYGSRSTHALVEEALGTCAA